MRIAYITPEFVTEPYFSGGLANYLNRIGRAMAGLGHDVHILVRADRDEELAWGERLTVHRIRPAAPESLRPLSLHRAPDAESWLGFSKAAADRLARIHAGLPVDLFQAANSRGVGVFSMLETAIPSATRISCYRPLWNKACEVPSTPDARAVEHIEHLQLKLCRHVFAPSAILAGVVEREVGLGPVPVIHTPVYMEAESDPSLYLEELEGKRYLLYVGRYQKHKGFHVLAQALGPVLEAFPDVHAVFVGMDCPDENGKSMRASAEEALTKFSSRLLFIGQTGHERLYPVMRGAELVVLPSLVDNMPNTCLEAMMLGRPVVGTGGASFDEVIRDGENGFLVPPGDARRLSRTVAEALARDDLARVGEAAGRSVAHLSPENVGKAHEAYYESVLACCREGHGHDIG